MDHYFRFCLELYLFCLSQPLIVNCNRDCVVSVSQDEALRALAGVTCRDVEVLSVLCFFELS